MRAFPGEWEGFSSPRAEDVAIRWEIGLSVKGNGVTLERHLPVALHSALRHAALEEPVPA